MGHDAAAAGVAEATAAAPTTVAAATSAADAAAVPAAPSPFEVYVHVPFCLRRCGYCDFNTYTSPDLGEGASRGNYARMAIREMQIVRDWQEERGLDEPPAGSVFFGGGTPTILPADDLVEMLDAVRRIWGLEPDAEITTEANPDTVDADYVRRLADGGFTRISFGMQSAVPAVLRTLDRRHTPANVEAGVRAADACGLRSSVDLIYGAPGESLDDWRTSVRAAVDLGVNHVSAYALTIAPRTAMGRRIAAGTLPRPSDDDEAAKYEIADELLSAAGLEWYEISNWSRPGYESRHNLGYWRNVDWAGIGPGAHSHYRFERRGSADYAGHVTLSNIPAVGMRSWDLPHPRSWGHEINSGTLPWGGSEAISQRQDAEETLMLGLRLHEGLDTARFSGIIPGEAWRQLESEGLLTLVHDVPAPRGPVAVPTRRGRLLNDLIIERLFDYL